MTIVRYTERWNNLLMRPAGGCSWLAPKTARDLYETKPGPGVMVVGGTEDPQTGDLVARWVLGFGTSSGVRVQLFNEHGTLTRVIDYDGIDGRLWRWVTIDYLYKNDTQRWSQRESILTIDTTVRPDGQGYFSTVDKQDSSSPRPVRESMEIEVPVLDSYWVDLPAFGDWGRLADPGPSAWEIAGRPTPAMAL